MALLLALLVQELRIRIDVRTEATGDIRLSCAPRGTNFPILEGRLPFRSRREDATWEERGPIRVTWAGLPAGRRLVYVRWDAKEPTPYVDGRWVDVGKDPEVTLEIRTSTSGTAEVALAPGVRTATVAFIPADVDGAVPDWSQRPEGPGFTAPVRDGKASFRGMRPGRYVFYPPHDHPDRPAPTVTAAVEIRPAAVTRVTLGAPSDK